MRLPVFVLGLFLTASISPLSAQSFLITGTVRNESGRPVADIRVSLLDENRQSIRTVFADTSGRFEFRGLRSGRIYIRVEPFGTIYEERIETLDLQSASPRANVEPIIVDLVLKPKKGETRAAPETVFFQNVPEKARDEYERGMNYLREKKPDKAIDALRRGIDMFPDYYLALELLGTEYVRQGKYDSALPVLQHAIEVYPSSAKSIYALGVAHLKLSHFQDSLPWLQKAVSLEPQNVNAYMMLGIAHGNLGALEPSEAQFKKAYEIGHERAADAHLYLAGIYNKRQKYAEAVRELQLYLKEVKDLKDRGKIEKMIQGLKEKEKAKKAP